MTGPSLLWSGRLTGELVSSLSDRKRDTTDMGPAFPTWAVVAVGDKAMTSAADDFGSDITTLRRQVETLRARHDAVIAEKAALIAVMDAINQSVDDPTPVFSAILESAVQLCDASAGLLSIHDGVLNHMVSSLGLTDEYAATMRKPWRSSSGGYSETLLRGKSHHHVLDLAADPDYLARSETARALVRLGGARTGLLVALRRHDRLLGLFTLYRTRVRGFTEQEIALVLAFAAQAVIAMENARLLRSSARPWSSRLRLLRCCRSSMPRPVTSARSLI